MAIAVVNSSEIGRPLRGLPRDLQGRARSYRGNNRDFAGNLLPEMTQVVSCGFDFASEKPIQ